MSANQITFQTADINFTYWMANSADPDQLASSGRVCPASARQGLYWIGNKKKETILDRERLLLIAEWSYFLVVLTAEFYCIINLSTTANSLQYAALFVPKMTLVGRLHCSSFCMGKYGYIKLQVCQTAENYTRSLFSVSRFHDQTVLMWKLTWVSNTIFHMAQLMGIATTQNITVVKWYV